MGGLSTTRLACASLAIAVLVTGAACTGPADRSGAPAAPDVGSLIDYTLEQDPNGTYRNVRTILVTVDGRTVVERHYGSEPAGSQDVEEEGRTILATLVGVALAERELRSLDDTLGTLLPEYRRWMTRDQAAITLRQILTMTAGLPEDSAFYDEVLVRHPGVD